MVKKIKSLIQSIRKEMPPPSKKFKAKKNFKKSDIVGRKDKHKKNYFSE